MTLAGVRNPAPQYELCWWGSASVPARAAGRGVGMAVAMVTMGGYVVDY